MRPENRTRRETEIFKAAYRVLDLSGPEGLTMLSVARAARASNETLYRWYGDKAGLFAALVRDNAAQVEAAMTRAATQDATAREALEGVGAVLFEMVTGPRAVALNRAAATDTTGNLGTALAREGRERISPLLGALIGRLLPHAPLPEATPLFIDLLLGDTQIRRATGAMPQPPEPGTGTARARLAVDRLIRLYPPGLERGAPSR
ncbi:MAG: TetR/AcrR family transcriptional regulator [Rhodobacteraceae bacterium]|nr:TetR/AcrR family transcriptional regulator [Paracoccaceae bacterium]